MRKTSNIDFDKLKLKCQSSNVKQISKFKGQRLYSHLYPAIVVTKAKHNNLSAGGKVNSYPDFML